MDTGLAVLPKISSDIWMILDSGSKFKSRVSGHLSGHISISEINLGRLGLISLPGGMDGRERERARTSARPLGVETNPKRPKLN